MARWRGELFVTFERPPHLRDPGAWESYLAEGNAKQARKRVSVDALIRDDRGRILLVDPVYKPDWDLPGGMAEANEPPLDAVRRELREELGLDLDLGRLLAVDWVAPHGPWDDLLNLIFDGGTLPVDLVETVRPRDDEIAELEFCERTDARQRLRPYVWRRMTAALEALEQGGVVYLHNGFRP